MINIRALYFRIRRVIDDFWYLQIVSRILPAHLDIRKAIPKYWTDVDSVIEEVMFQALISFWEPHGENGEQHLRYQFAPKKKDLPYSPSEKMQVAKSKRAYLQLKAAYEWAKVRKEKCWRAKTFEELSKTRDLETKHLLTIIRYRGYLWT